MAGCHTISKSTSNIFVFLTILTDSSANSRVKHSSWVEGLNYDGCSTKALLHKLQIFSQCCEGAGEPWGEIMQVS